MFNNCIRSRLTVLQVPSVSEDSDFTSEPWSKSRFQHRRWRGSSPRTRSHSHLICCARLTSG